MIQDLSPIFTIDKTINDIELSDSIIVEFDNFKLAYKKECKKSLITRTNKGLIYIYGEAFNCDGLKLKKKYFEVFSKDIFSNKARVEDLLLNIFGRFFIVLIKKGVVTIYTDSSLHMDLFCYNKTVYSPSIKNLYSLCKEKNFILSRNTDVNSFYYIYSFFPQKTTQFNEISKHKNYIPTKKHNYQKLPKQKVLSKFNSLFLEALENQTEGEKDIALLLGGVDSSMVASGLKKIGKNVKGYTFKFAEDEFNQKKINETVEHLKINHEWVKISENAFFEKLYNFPEISNSPNAYPFFTISSIITIEKISSDGLINIQTGFGVDKLFKGRTNLSLFNNKYEKYLKNNKKLNSMVLSLVNTFPENLGHLHTIFNSILKSPKPELSFRVIDETRLQALFPKINLSLKQKFEKNIKSQLSEIDNELIPYEQYILRGIEKNLLQDIYKFNNLTIHSPFFHEPLVNFVHSQNYKMDSKKNLGKKLLLDACEQFNYLPQDVIYQKKINGSLAPIDQWYKINKNEVINFIIKHNPDISHKNLENLFKEKLIENFYLKYFSSDGISTHFLSTYLTELIYSNLANNE
jgi:asparagine synthetase B (glutamine-hydrolysing)